jgi:hypothetical protein
MSKIFKCGKQRNTAALLMEMQEMIELLLPGHAKAEANRE